MALGGTSFGGWWCGSSILSEEVSLLQLPWWVCVSGRDFLDMLDGVRGNDLADGDPDNRDDCVADQGDREGQLSVS
jgi:hypothetical protein